MRRFFFRHPPSFFLNKDVFFRGKRIFWERIRHRNYEGIYQSFLVVQNTYAIDSLEEIQLKER